MGTQTMMLSGAIYPVYKLMPDAGHKVNWKDYLQPVLSYYMNADGKLMSVPFNSSTPVMYYNGTWVAIAAALLVMLPPILVALFIQRWFVKGLVDS